MNLIFRHKGRLRQGEEFIHWYTGDVVHPLVYLSSDGTEVFLVSHSDTGAHSVRALSPRQWMQVRAKYRLPLDEIPAIIVPPVAPPNDLTEEMTAGSINDNTIGV